jgi:hypothetical protein
MKPIHTLTWAVSAPIMLFAGATQAANITISDAYCSNFSFNSSTSTISCDGAAGDPPPPPSSAPSCTVNASKTAVDVNGTATITANCDQSPTSWQWITSSGAPVISDLGGVLTFPQAGTFDFQVRATNTVGQGSLSPKVSVTVSAASGGGTGGGSAGSCPSTPAGITIVQIGSKDNYEGNDFDVVFDNPGSTFNSAVGSGESKALQFSNTSFKTGIISATEGSYGAGYKDWSISLCPGDFTASLGTNCVKLRRTSLNMQYSTDGSQGCTIPVGTPIYFNVRGYNGASAGWVAQNLKLEDLP